MVIGLMRGSIKTIAHTIATPHTKIEGTMNVTKMTSLVMLTIEDTLRLRNPPRTVRLATMPTMWKQVKLLLAIVPALVVLTPPLRKSRRFAYNHLHESVLEVPLRAIRKKTTTFSWENPPQSLVMIPVNG
jgi:hypothetical protein